MSSALNSRAARIHVLNGTLRRSSGVPTVTLNDLTARLALIEPFAVAVLLAADLEHLRLPLHHSGDIGAHQATVGPQGPLRADTSFSKGEGMGGFAFCAPSYTVFLATHKRSQRCAFVME